MYPYMITYRRTLCSQLHVFSSWLLQDASTLWTMVDDAASSLSAISSSTCASLADKDGWDVELPQNCWTCGRYWKWAAGDWRAVCQFCRDQQSCAMYLAWVRVADAVLQQWRAIHPCGRNAWEIPSTHGMEDFCRPINRSIDRQIHSSKTREIERMIDRGIDPLIDHSIDRPPHRPLERSTARSISIRPTAGLVG